jgi:hypothetical protein
MAQLGERCLRKAEATGSTPVISTTSRSLGILHSWVFYFSPLCRVEVMVDAYLMPPSNFLTCFSYRSIALLIPLKSTVTYLGSYDQRSHQGTTWQLSDCPDRFYVRFFIFRNHILIFLYCAYFAEDMQFLHFYLRHFI